jgi:hypothetical protein
MIASGDVGQTLLLHIGYEGTPVTRHGTICRYAEDSGNKYVAVKFTGTPPPWV